MRHRFVVATCLLGLWPVRMAQADQIVTQGINHSGAAIVGVDEGRLRFRTADGKLQSAWINDIGLIVVDRGGIFDDFNQAERFLAEDEPVRAILRYRRAWRLSTDFWTDLIAARLVLACDRAKQLDTATLNFIRVLRGTWAGPSAAARLIPREISVTGGRRAKRAIQQLDAALAKDPGESQRPLLEIVRYEIFRRTGDRRAASAAKRVAALSMPVIARSEQVYGIQLHALRESLKDNIDPAGIGNLDRAIRDCPETVLPGLLLLKGEALLRTASTREDIIRAAWPYLRVAIHFPDDPRAADGLYGAATALDRLGGTAKAIELLEECLGHKRVTTRTRRLAEEARTRLQSTMAPSPGWEAETNSSLPLP